jgi:adenosine deaminase
MSRFYDGLYALHPDESADEITSMASVILVQAVQKSRDQDKIESICGVDIAGAERGNEAAVHEKAFDLAHRYFFHKTVHAGEGFGPESIGQAVKYLHAERIGHGFHLFNADLVTKGTEDASEYVKRLVNWVSDLRITMEVCLTSNLNTMPKLKIEDHPFGKMIRNRISVTINTDNRLISNTNTVEELKKAAYTFDLNPKELRELVITGFKRSFFPGDYPSRRKYVRQVMDYYDEVSRKHGIDIILDPLTPTK